MATNNIANLLLQIGGDPSKAKKALQEVAAEVRAFAAQHAEATLGVAGVEKAQTQIKDLEKSLAVISGRKVSATVKVDVKDAEAKLRQLRKELELAGAGGAGARSIRDIVKDIDKVGSKFEGLGAKLGSKFGKAFEGLGEDAAHLATTVGTTLGSALEHAGSFFSTLGEGAVKLGSSIGGALVSGFISLISTAGLALIALAILVPVITALLAVVIALASSLAAAAAGAGVLFIGALGALLPVILVVALAIKTLVGAFQALGQAHKDAKANSEALKRAQEAEAQAQTQAAAAAKNVADTRVAGLKAERDAAFAAKDAQYALEEARLGQGDASLRLDRAKQALKDLKSEAAGAGPVLGDLFKRFTDVNFTPKDAKALLPRLSGAAASGNKQLDVKAALLEYAHAQLGVKEAAENTTEATAKLSDAQQANAKFQKQGVRAYQPYIDALHQAAAANRSLARAEAATEKARLHGDGQRDATSKFSKSELAAAQSVKDFVKSVKADLGPALQATLKGVGKLFEGLTVTFKDPEVKAAFTDIGRALEESLGALGDLAKTKEVRTIFADLAGTGAKLVRAIGGHVIPDVVKILLRLADAGAKPLEGMFDSIGRFFDSLEGKTRDSKKLDGGINGLLKSFRIWIGIIKQVALLLLNLFKDGKSSGDKLATSILHTLEHLNGILGTKKGRQEFQDWLDRNVTRAKAIAGSFEDLYNFIKKVLPLANGLLGAAEKAVKFTQDTGKAARSVTNTLGVTKSDKDTIDTHSVEDERNALNFFKSLVPKFFAAKGDRKQQLYAALVDAARNVATIPGFMYSNNPDKVFTDNKVKVRPGTKFQWGGLVGGAHGVDGTPLLGEGGEYMVRAAVVSQLGKGYFDALNSGVSPRKISIEGKSGGSRGDIYIQQAPGPAAAIQDGRHQAAVLGRELRKRGI